MKVKLIDGDFTKAPNPYMQAILKVGDPVPEAGKEYVVIGHGDIHGVSSYELEGFDYSSYGWSPALFKASRFEVIDSPFEPNAILPDGTLVRQTQMYVSMAYKMPKQKLPRKLKKRWKNGMLFVHKGDFGIKPLVK